MIFRNIEISIFIQIKFVYVQIQDKSWDGVYVDIRQQNTVIPPRSHIKLVVRSVATGSSASCSSDACQNLSMIEPARVSDSANVFLERVNILL